MTKRILAPNTIIPSFLYVERAADRQLKSVVDEMGRPAYVLVARQMGKTNLLLNMKRSRTEDLVIYLDLSNRSETARSFFRSIIDTILESFPDQFKSSAADIDAQRRDNVLEPSVEYDRHLRAILKSCEKKVVIILDEIDSLIGCSYSDTVLAQIRSMYFSRANYGVYERLTYVLSGVAEPGDLIKDKNISPFNIGEKIYLEDFNSSEFERFLQAAKLDVASDIVSRIVWWTDGSPRISWDICSEVELELINGVAVTTDTVDSIVNRLYLREFDRAPIDHIRTLVEGDADSRKAIMSIRHDRADFVDDKTKAKLYLAGISKLNSAGCVSIKNRVVDAAISERWIQQLDAQEGNMVSDANAAFSRKDYDTAIALYNQAMISEPDTVTDGKLFELGEAYLFSSDFENAVLQFGVVEKQARDSKLQQLSALNCGLAYLLNKNYPNALDCFNRASLGSDKSLSVSAKLNKQVLYARLNSVENREAAILESISLISEIESIQEHDQQYLLTTALANQSLLHFVYGENEACRELLSRARDSAPIEYLPYLLLEVSKRSQDALEKSAALAEFVNLIEANKFDLTDDLHTALGLTRAVLGQAMLSLVELQQDSAADRLMNAVNKHYYPGPRSLVAVSVDLAESVNEVEPGKGLKLLQYCETNYLNDNLPVIDKIRLYRHLANTSDTSATGTRGLAYLNTLNKSCPVDMLGEADAVAAMHVIAGRFHSNKTGLVECFTLWEKFEKVTSEKWPELALFYYYLRLNNAQSAKNDASSVMYAKALLEMSGAAEMTSSLAESYTPFVLAAENTIKKAARKKFKDFRRNDRIIIKYAQEEASTVKFKVVEDDLYLGKCEFIGRA